MPLIYRNKIKTFQPGILTVILIVSVVLRVIPALILGNTVVELPGTSDQVSYHSLAQRVLAGNGFSFDQNWWPATRAGEPTAHWSFLYTLFLVVTYALFGINPIVARVIQAIIVGILHPFLVYKIGSELVGRKTGIIAAGLTAIYAYFIYYSAALMTEPFYITTILAAIYLAIQMTSPTLATRRKYWLAVGLGIVLGLTVLLRQLIMIFIPFMLFWVAWREWKHRWSVLLVELILPVAVVGLMILPFTLYNYQRFHQFVLLNTNSGYAFFFGNHPIYGTQFVPILTPEMGSYHDLIPQELLALDEAAMDKALMKQAVSFILADPLRYLLLSLSRIPIYFQFWPSASSGLVSNLTRVASFGLFLPFMLYGLVRWVVTGGFRRISSPSWLLLLFMLFYAGIHILTWTLIRYRLPIDAILIIFASIAVQDLYSFLRNKRIASTALVKP
jgi:4-amino-4-deoxy-L-arabinose transferase-like glycosyltransferase